MTARADVHDSFRHRLVDAAYRRLAADGAAGLGMRKLAADLDVTPGALYRYVAGRDELLTILVVDAYRSLNDAMRQAVTAQERADLEVRWVAAWCAARDWALDFTHKSNPASCMASSIGASRSRAWTWASGTCGTFVG